MRTVLFLFFLIFLIPLSNYAQDQKKIDSLQNVLAMDRFEHDTLKVLTYFNLLKVYYQKDEDSVIRYAKLALEESQKIDYAFGISQGYLYQSAIPYHKGDYDSYIVILNKAYEEVKDLNNIKVNNFINTRLGVAYKSQKKYDTALMVFNRALDIAIKNNLSTSISSSYLNIGNVYYNLNQYDIATQYYLKGDSVCSTLSKPHNTCAATLIGIANTYARSKQYKEAGKYYKGAKELYIEMDYPESALRTNYYIGKNLIDLDSSKKAIPIFIEAYNHFSARKQNVNAYNLSIEIAWAYEALKEKDSAFKYYKIAENLSENTSINKSAPKIGLSEVLKNQGKYYQALIKAEEAYQASKEEKNLHNLKRSLRLLFKTNNELNNYKEATIYYDEFITVNDCLVIKGNIENLQQIQTEYETKKKEQEIALLTAQNTLAEEQKENQRNIFITAVSVVSLAALFFFFQYRNRQKTNRKLRELDAAKSTFFTNISHDFRTPLTLIKGPIEDQLENTSLSIINRKNLNAAFKNTERLENLVGQLMSLSKLNSSAMPLQVQPVDIDAFLKMYTHGFQYQSEEQGLHFSLTTKIEENDVWLDQDIIEKILYNLLGNALKYASENGQIEISGTTKNGVFQLSVYNSAGAISEEEKEFLFKRFYQTSSSNQGTGIGLSLIKQLVILHKGTISVENKKDGIIFTVNLPTNKEVYNQNETLNEVLHSKNKVKIIENEKKSQLVEIGSDAPVLLVVDDSEDIRTYVQSIFQEIYVVLIAMDGKEGCVLAEKHIPDIIISDIMMPIMDGYALTKHIKENPITSHIPIILLTAKNKEVDQLEAIDIGADIYTTKPFSSKLLKANVANLIENRRKLQERFAQELILTPKDIAVTTADEDFLNRLQEVLDKHLTETDFTALKFSEVMLMNRMQLHRKLKALTGLSSSEFIKNQRLKIAAQLIKTKDLNISEVGYSTGFNDPSYFAKCFKKEYGVSPKEFASQNRESQL